MHMQEKLFCNACGKEIILEKSIIREGCFRVDYTFGYFSKKDGIRHRFDLCEECYDNIVQNFKIPVEELESTELL